MTRQLDLEHELKETAKRDALVAALEYSLAGSLEFYGMELRGFAINYDKFSCLMTIKAIRNNRHQVSFISSDSIMNCFLAADSASRRDGLRWSVDKYQPDEV
jgi:hypothetical protein